MSLTLIATIFLSENHGKSLVDSDHFFIRIWSSLNHCRSLHLITTWQRRGWNLDNGGGRCMCHTNTRSSRRENRVAVLWYGSLASDVQQGRYYRRLAGNTGGIYYSGVHLLMTVCETVCSDPGSRRVSLDTTMVWRLATPHAPIHNQR